MGRDVVDMSCHYGRDIHTNTLLISRKKMFKRKESCPFSTEGREGIAIEMSLIICPDNEVLSLDCWQHQSCRSCCQHVRAATVMSDMSKRHVRVHLLLSTIIIKES